MPLTPPDEAPAITSTMTRKSRLWRPYGFQEIEIDLFGGVLGTVEPGGLVVVPRSLLLGGLLGIVVRAGSAYELQDFLGYPVLIDSE